MNLSKFKNGICEVKSMENDILIVGKVKAIHDGVLPSVDIKVNAKESLINQPIGIPVKLSIKSGKNSTIVGGFLALISEEMCKINKIGDTVSVERREFFRIRSHATGSITRFDKEANDDKSFQAKLVDISLSGIRFATDAFFAIDDTIEITGLSLVRSEVPFNFSCKVKYRDDIMRREVLEGYSYRCTLEGVSTITSDRLAKAIFEMQRDQIKRQKAR